MLRSPNREKLVLIVPGLLLLGTVAAVFGFVADDEGASTVPTFSRFVVAPSGPTSATPVSVAHPETGARSVAARTPAAVDTADGDLGIDEYLVQVVDDEGRPVRSAAFAIARRWRAFISNGASQADLFETESQYQATTDEHGTLRFHGDAGWQYELLALTDGFAPKRFRLIDPGRKLIRLERPASIAGHVYDASGRGVEGVIVDLWHDEGAQERRITDANGWYEFETVTPRLATLRLRPAHHLRPRVEHVKVEPGMRSLRDFDLESGRPLDVETRDVAGEAVAGAAIEVSEARTGEIVAIGRSGRDGKARFDCLAAEREYVIAAIGPKNVSARVMITSPTAAEIEPLRETLTLTAPWTFHAVVRTQEGIPVEGALVVLESRPFGRVGSTSHSGRGRSLADGQVTVSGLVEGVPYSGVVFHPQFGLATLSSLTAAANGESTVELRLEEPGWIWGTALRPDGAPLENAMIWLNLPGSTEGEVASQILVRTDRFGRYAVSNLPLGARVSVEVVDPQNMVERQVSTMIVSDSGLPEAFGGGRPPVDGAALDLGSPGNGGSSDGFRIDDSRLHR